MGDAHFSSALPPPTGLEYGSENLEHMKEINNNNKKLLHIIITAQLKGMRLVAAGSLKAGSSSSTDSGL